MFALRSVFLFVAASIALPGAVFTITPETIYSCSNGLGHATLAWSEATGPVQVRIGNSQGSPVTGFEGTSGSSTTGDWIADNMTFYLVNQAGGVEANVTARVRCGGTVDTLEQGLKNGSYFPLQVNNTWVYRINSRQETSSYATYSITSTEIVGGLTYFVLSLTSAPVPIVTAKLRSDDQGRIWQLTEAPPGEKLLLDPATAQLGPHDFAFGMSPDAAFVTEPGLASTTYVYVRGIGLTRSDQTLHTGSSGGFVAGQQLVEVRLADGVHLSIRTSRLALSMESNNLDVTNKKAPNCIVPQYCAACFLIGADSPDTYKPCAQARVEASASGRYTFELELRNSEDQIV
jgi:hypothetical protein